MPGKNHGYIKGPIHPGVGMIGGVGDTLGVILPSGDWEPYLPDFEAQSKLGLETMNCVQFSRLNVSETQAKFYGNPLNLSDRFLYWASGCTERGNTFSNCDYGFKRFGAPPESSWPWLTAITRDEYGKEPPDDVKAEAAEILDEWDIGLLTWVPADVEKMREALKKGPLWFCNDIHAMEIYRVDDRIRVFDTYGSGKGSFPLDYVQHIEAIYLAPFTPKKNAPMKFVENMKYQLVEGVGGFLIFINGRMYRDTEAKIESTWTTRNAKPLPDGTFFFYGGPIGMLKLKDLDGVPLFNLKNEPTTL